MTSFQPAGGLELLHTADPEVGQGINVKKGKLYWVVLRPERQFQDTWEVWADNYAEKQGKYFSNNTGTGLNTGYQVLSAVGVFGR